MKGNTQKKNFRSKRNSKFSKEAFVKEDQRQIERKCNDPQWYIREGQLAKDVASFSFNTALGTAVEINADRSVNKLVGKRIAVPGIMTIHTVPAVGYSADGSSPINLAAKNLYSWVRHANSGHSNYDSPDLMLYIMAMDSIYAFIWHMQRAYGTARVYSQKNRYIGDCLLRAMGFVPDDVRQNLADFRSYINMLIVKASAFCTPVTMSIFQRHTWMYSGVFKDEDVDKSQMYLYVPDFLYLYDENSGAGKLDPLPVVAKDTPSGNGIENRTQLLNSWYAIGNAMINRMVASEDINIMSGDIRKAFGEDKLWKIALVNEDYAVVPIYSGEILDQIHNTVFTGDAPINPADRDVAADYTYDISALTIYQDVLDPLEPIKQKPLFADAFACAFEHFCDMEENEPSPERILVATRNMIHGVHEYNASAGKHITDIDSYGSDLCLYAEMMSMTSGGSIMYSRLGGAQFAYIDVEAYTKFHKAPLVYKIIGDTSDPTQANLEEVLGELGDFIVMDYTDIDKMHQSAILSMLGVPV